MGYLRGGLVCFMSIIIIAVETWTNCFVGRGLNPLVLRSNSEGEEEEERICALISRGKRRSMRSDDFLFFLKNPFAITSRTKYPWRERTVKQIAVGCCFFLLATRRAAKDDAWDACDRFRPICVHGLFGQRRGRLASILWNRRSRQNIDPLDAFKHL